MSALDYSLPGGLRGQLCGEVLAALSACEPRIARDLLQHCPSAAESQDVSRAIYDLRQRGLVINAVMVEPPDRVKGARPLQSYVLSEAAVNWRLAEHLERELATSPALSEPDLQVAGKVAEPDVPANQELNLDTEWPDALEDAPSRQLPQAKTKVFLDACKDCGAELDWYQDNPDQCAPCAWEARDPILAAIYRLEEPRLVDAARDAVLLRALAESLIMRKAPEVSQWLQDLACKLEKREA